MWHNKAFQADSFRVRDFNFNIQARRLNAGSLNSTRGNKIMDRVDDIEANFKTLEELNLSQEDEKLLNKICNGYKDDHNIRLILIERGLSTSKKLVVKPKKLFPLLVKLDNKEVIQSEEIGDKVIRHRVPPHSIPPLDRVEFIGNRGAIGYRYITGGRVRDIVRRFDTELVNLSTFQACSIINDIYDVILKKCHWLDENYEMKKVELREMPFEPELKGDAKWLEMCDHYEKARNICSEIKAPHGIVHGDLHPKNVLISRQNAPVLIDFSMVKTELCQFFDFAKFEVNLQFQCAGPLAKKMWRIEDLMYGKTPLIIPHSNSKLATCIHRIRANLWQGCTRFAVKMDSQAIDFVYRGYLIYCLMRIYSRVNNSQESRNHAYSQVMSLSFPFE